MAHQFGFPTWTLWGMGLAAFAALAAVFLAYLAQSPRLLTRLNLTGRRLDLRARAFTGYALALLLLAMGFFLAGVPLDAGEGGAVAESTSVPDEGESAGTVVAGDMTVEAEIAGGQSGAMVGLPTQTPGGASGAMSGLITPQPTLEPGEIITGTLESAGSDPPPAATQVPPAGTPETEATATRFPTATPSPEPSPTPSPTPILLPTARINDQTSTLPVRRLPGGPVLVVLVRGDTVIPLTGNAFHSGEVWQEIQTVDGVIGWVPDRFLEYGSSGE